MKNGGKFEYNIYFECLTNLFLHNKILLLPASVTLSLTFLITKFSSSAEPPAQLINSHSLTTPIFLISNFMFGKKFKVNKEFMLGTGAKPSGRAAHGAVCI